MAVNIIRGEIGSGRSALCMEMIKRVHEKYPEDKCIMLVPNHYSYETERRFVKEFGGTGINNIEVMTLRKLAINLLDSASLNYITAAGRHMLIHKAVSNFCENADKHTDALLLASMKKAGFTDVMSSLISEFKRYMVDFSEMEEQAEKIENALLRSKLTAAARIYKSYTEYIDASDYTDSEDDNIRLAERILSGGEFGPHTHVWVDSFDELSPQQRRVIEAMAIKGAPLTISVCRSNSKPIYEHVSDTERAAFDIASRAGLGEVIDTDDGFKGNKREDIRFLLDNWGSANKKYDKKPENISLFSARDIYSEVEKTACKITDLVREQSLRYRDIAILCGSTENYNHIIETIFDEYKIPYFTDSTIALADHPIAMQLLSVFDIFENDWTYEAMFRYLKAGFIYRRAVIDGKRVLLPLNPTDIDSLENYVLKYGIIGASRWTREEEWMGGEEMISTIFRDESADVKPDDDGDAKKENRIDKLRREIAEPLMTLYEKTRGQMKAENFARSVFEFLCEINLSAGLKTEVRILRNEGHINEAEQFTKLWNLLLDVLNQTTVALRDEEIDFIKFGEYVRVGLSQCEIRTIPSGLDQVYVGNVEKCSATNVRAMFIVGANDGTFPTQMPTEGFFSNADRNLLGGDYGIVIAPDTKQRQEKQYFKVYRAICAVSEQLFISRPVQSADGRALMPSAMISDIERVIPNIRRSDDIIWDSENEHMYISTPEATIHRMLINKSARHAAPRNPVWDAAYEWYTTRDEWKDLVSLIDRAKWYMKPDVVLDIELAKKLYDAKTTYSASRLNAFALCPFGYFMQYGIRAKEREIWDISPADVGTYAHEVIRRFCEAVEGDTKTDSERIEKWKSLTDAERERILDEITAQAIENILQYGGHDKERSANIMMRTGKNIKNAAKTVHRALSRGKYAQRGLELEFNLALTDTVSIYGIIDRVDALTDALETRIRIVDYKTGRTSFDIGNISNGVDMQMVIYAIAAAQNAREQGENPRVTGMYYNKVHSRMMSLPMGTQKSDADEMGDAQLKLDGVTFIRSNEDLYEIDPEMRDTKKSDFLNIEYGVRGGLKDKNSLRTEEEMLGLMTFVEDKIIEADEKIKSGCIDCEPYTPKEGKAACTYCAYMDVCRFKNAPVEKKCTLKDEQIWAVMEELGKKKGGDGDGSQVD